MAILEITLESLHALRESYKGPNFLTYFAGATNRYNNQTVIQQLESPLHTILHSEFNI